MIKNRCSSVYKGDKFLVSKLQEAEHLCNLVVQHGLQLKVAYDVPQVYTAHNVKKPEKYMELLKATEPLRGQIDGVHLWGKHKSKYGRLVAHYCDLTFYFDGDMELKGQFLQMFNRCFDDGLARKMVLGVNSGNEDLLSIVGDLRDNRMVFI